jgi:E3 ubiquitin-protein ligase CBL
MRSSIITTHDDDAPPPVPPRKSVNLSNQSDFNRPLKPQLAPPVEPLPIIEKCETPQAPEPSPNPSFLAVDENYDDDEEDPICGPAETITGLIDTRPLEQRTNYISFASLTNNVTSNFNLITINDSSTAKENSNGENKNSNTYLLKNNQLNNNFSNLNGTNHQRHMSVPVVGAKTPQTKSLPTSSSTFQASINQQAAAQTNNSSSLKSTEPSSVVTNHQLYENMNVKMKSGGIISLNSINNNSSNNVPYENINLEYINRLMMEGYSKENVVAALGISRNNFEMACDILHEFVSTNHQAQAGKVCENNR